jgi:hypothetical protein
MICRQLEQHWMMCRTLRGHNGYHLTHYGLTYFLNKKQTMLSSALETKAVAKVTATGFPSNQRKL